MKAAALVGLRRIEIQDKPKPVIQSGEVLVKVEYCGICGSDVHAYVNGLLYPLGTVMGHEFSGGVAEIGDEVQAVRVGDRVAVKPSAVCLNCFWCQRGQYSLCPKRPETIIGIRLENDGAFAEYVKIRYPNQMLFKLPSNVASEQAALAEPLSISLHSLRRSQFKAGDSVLIVGAGMIGLGILQFVKLKGAGKTMVLEVSEKKSLIAKRLGADVVLNPNSEGAGLRDHIVGLMDGRGPDIVFECAGVTAAFQASIDYVRSGGQVMLVSVYEQDVLFSAYKLLHKEVELKGVLSSYDEFKDVLDLLDQGKINTEVMISDIIPADDLIVSGFERLAATHDMVKILTRRQG
jgi:(R,R)-butanediol dehydrogenase/meso-butanediol dehydrogenase/diacetyl reductase